MLNRRQLMTATAAIGAVPFATEEQLLAAEFPVANERDYELFHYIESIRFRAEKMRRALLDAEGAPEHARRELMLELRQSFMFLRMSGTEIDAILEAFPERYPHWPMPEV